VGVTGAVWNRYRLPAVPRYPDRQLVGTGRGWGVWYRHWAFSATHGAGTIHRANWWLF